MNPISRFTLILLLLGAGCQDSGAPAAEPPEAPLDGALAEQPPADEASAGETPAALEPLLARSSGEVWLDTLEEWENLKRLVATEKKTSPLFEEMDANVDRLDVLRHELRLSLELAGTERLHVDQALLVYQAAVFSLGKVVKAQIPGRLPEAMELLHSQLWAVQAYFPAGYLPGPPVPWPASVPPR